MHAFAQYRHQLLLLVALATTFACQPAKAPGPVQLRSLDERRSLAIIEQTAKQAGEAVSAGRTHAMPNGAMLHEDLMLGPGPYGIAFLTEREVDKLKAAVPPYKPDATQLRLVRPNNGAIVLVLYEQNYRYDISQHHTITVVTAEKKLARDVSDYLHHVVKPAQQR